MKVNILLIAVLSIGIGAIAEKPSELEIEKSVDVSGKALAFRVISFNILVDRDGHGWKDRGLTVAQMLESSGADVMGIQEASKLQIASLQEHLRHYFFFVGDRSDGHRNDQKWYEFMPIFYLKDRFHLLEKSSFWVSEDPARPGGRLKAADGMVGH
jgi:hypothetical protein